MDTSRIRVNSYGLDDPRSPKLKASVPGSPAAACAGGSITGANAAPATAATTAPSIAAVIVVTIVAPNGGAGGRMDKNMPVAAPPMGGHLTA